MNLLKHIYWNSVEIARPKPYLKLAEWAESGGSTYPDWYLDESGYRNDNHIYPIS